MSSSLFDTLDRKSGIRAGERRLAYGALATQLLIGAGHAQLETARDTVFLSRLTPAQLPFMYLAVALLGFLMTEGNRRSMLRQRTRSGLTGFLVLGGLVTAAFATLHPSAAVVYALYLWSAICGPWAVLQFSLQLAAELSVEQAKRLLGFVGAGAVLGAVLGSAIARAMLEFSSSRSLVVSAGVFFVLAGLGPARMRPPTSPREARRGEAYRTTRTEASDLLRDQYRRGLLLLMLSSTIALTVVDYLFKSEAARAFPDPHTLATFLSSTQVATNLASLLVQVFAVAGVLRALGAHGALLLLPLCLLGGTGLLAFGAGFAGALALRGADGTLRYSVHRTAIDILYFPLPDSARRRMKPVMEILGQRGGQAIAALLLLGVTNLWLSDTVERWVLLGALATMLVSWMVAALKLHRPYVDLFKSSLTEHRVLAPQLSSRELALPVLEAALTSLNSQSPREVMAALELLSGYRDGRLLPALVLYHPDPDVLVRALDLFAEVERHDVLPSLDRLLGHDDARVRTAALRARIGLAPDERALRLLAQQSTQPELASTALVGLVAQGWLDETEAEHQVMAWAAEHRRHFVEPLARAALAADSTPALRRVLCECLRAASTQQEQAIVAAALARHPTPAALEPLLALLTHREPREAARDALLALGELALHELAKRLHDTSTPYMLRRHLPETIRRFPAQAAARVLERQLPGERDGVVRFKLLRSLNRLRRSAPGLSLDEQLIGDLLAQHIDRMILSIHWYQALRAQFEPSDPPSSRSARSTRQFSFVSSSLELLIEILHDKQRQALERVLRLANLLLPKEDFRPIMLGLRSRNDARRATALEVLTAALPLRFRDVIVDLASYTYNPEVHGLRTAEADPALDGEAALGAMTQLEAGTVRALALYAAAELGYSWVEAALADESTQRARASTRRLYDEAARAHGVASGPFSSPEPA